jgi:hypothetical protein
VSDPDFDPNLIHELLEVFLENVMVSVIAAAAITQPQNCSGIWKSCLSILIPPRTNTIAGKLVEHPLRVAGVFAGA